MGWYIVTIEVLITFFVSRLIYKKRYADLKTVFDRTLKNLRKDSVFLPSLLEWSKKYRKSPITLSRTTAHCPWARAPNSLAILH